MQIGKMVSPCSDQSRLPLLVKKYRIIDSRRVTGLENSTSVGRGRRTTRNLCLFLISELNYIIITF